MKSCTEGFRGSQQFGGVACKVQTSQVVNLTPTNWHLLKVHFDGVLFFQRSFLSLLYRIQRQGNVLIQRQEDVLIGYDWLSDALEHVKSIFSEVCD
jgi:hypothetical protein